MIATVRTNKIFNGKIYAKDNPNSCVVDVESGIEFKIQMGYNDIECNVKRKSQGVYSNEVIIQHHDSIVTSSDLGLALNCQYDLSNRTIMNDFDLAIDGEIEASLFEESVVDSPNVIMTITGRGGSEIESAQVGDPLELRFEILDQSSPYEIFVRDLVAKDGNDQSEIVLLDSRGCPAEGQIMGPLLKDPNNPKVLITNFDAFKFPTSEIVQFRAHITPCMPTCEPVECIYKDYYGGDNTRISSYGKRRKREIFEAAVLNPRHKRSFNSVTGKKVLVTQAFVVTDKFKNKRRPVAAERPSISMPESRPNNVLIPPRASHEFDFENTIEHVEQSSGTEVCLNTTGIIVAIAMFIIIQLLMAFICTQFWQRKRKSSLRQKEEQDAAVRSVFNPYSIRK